MAKKQPDRAQRLSHAEYFALEQAEDQRYEFLAGEAFAMTGGTETHALIAANTLAALVNALRDRPCRVYGADMKLRIATHNKFCYPDAMVLCERGRRHDLYVEEPALIVEVLSETTESYDRGLKFEHYRSIPALRYYLLLSQERLHVELFHWEQQDVWSFRETGGETGAIELTQWGVSLPLEELYRNVDFRPDRDKPEK